ncbi:pyridoxal 5'-phosphate synthase [Streptomyces sp. NPDC093252]|uniref:pyridoxal 5'-phosphate synthase n=1 Tax=Streptomyces sp. NPDC093252 TaxID=3154980 RepID=UPI003432ABD5
MSQTPSSDGRPEPGESPQHLFSYGTLQLPQVQLSQFGRLLEGRPDRLPGHRTTSVLITDPAVIEASGTDRHPLVVPSADPADAVEGQVFPVGEADLALADSYEVDDYVRTQVTLESGLRAWVYLERPRPAPGARRPADTEEDIRQWLRGLEVFAGPLAGFDPASAPADPVALFLDWLRAAVAAGVPDPHAMTLSTVGEDGLPDARVLILKNVDDDGWQFAVHGSSPKGRQLARRPGAALTFYWPPLGRQVRLRGPVGPAPAEQSAADLLARATTARAEALIGRQSRHLTGPEERASALREALARIASDPGLVSPDWTLYTLAPTAIEFWQADKDRLHERLRYERPDPRGPWERHRLWP